MSTDRARRSFDASRMYRSVVSQQGRVTVEADANEAEDIRTAQSRAELTDVVGPTGTPDDGFKISVAAGSLDFAIGQGTLYVGGVRVVVQDDTLTYLGQKRTEWVDYPAGAPARYPPTTPLTELVFLALTDQEVSAVEDPALREPALGGPDTAGRTRLIQRVHRAPMTGTDCDAALESVLHTMSPGLVFDPETRRLTSTAQLEVDFVPVPDQTDQCQPTAQAGFLGPENQLIRVQVAARAKPTDPDTLLWGYDNASFLYRAGIDSANRNQLALQGTPVDVFHRPLAGQWVEVLGTAVTLGVGAYLANPTGAAREIATYDPARNLITLTNDLPPALFDSQAPQVFVRIWEKQLPFAGNGTTATPLVTAGGSSTGVLVSTKGAAVPGDYWMIGVRPSTPETILPSRLFRQFQPPDGPGRWATPLATIAWNKDATAAAVHDCRRPFDNLVELTRQQCCELKVLHGDDAQAIIAARIRWNAEHGIAALHVRFAAGVFDLDAPLVMLAVKGGELTVSGCGTTLVAATQETALVLQGWDSASLFDLSVEAAVAKPGHGKKLRQDTVPQARGDEFRHLGGAITFLDCKSSNVERVVGVCGSGYRRAASCLTIRNPDDRPGDVRVRSCDFSAGARQIGVLLVNVDRASVDDNQIGSHRDAAAPVPADVLKRTLISHVRVVTKGAAPPSVTATRVVGTFALAGGDRALQYLTDERLPPEAWAQAFAELAPRITPAGAAITRADRRRIQRTIEAVLMQIVRPKRRVPLKATTLEPFRKWLADAMRAEAVVAGPGQGIVVSGVQANDIRILHNTIADAMDGIHIGLSTRGTAATRAEPLFADRVQVVGKSISVRVPWYERGAHSGILVGNVHVATLRDNRVEFQLLNLAGPVSGPRVNDFVPKTFPVTRRGDGIRVWGVPGEAASPRKPPAGHMILIAGNVVQDAEIGIRVVQMGDASADALCRLTQNLAVRAQEPWVTSTGVVVADDNMPPPSHTP